MTHKKFSEPASALLEAIAAYHQRIQSNEEYARSVNRLMVSDIYALGDCQEDWQFTSDQFDRTFSKEEKIKLDIFRSLLNIYSQSYRISELSNYFQIFPDIRGKISLKSHLGNSVELFVSSIYQTKEYIKNTRKLCENFDNRVDINWGKLIKLYGKHFDVYLRLRSSVHHHEVLSYDELGRIGMLETLRISNFSDHLPSEEEVFIAECCIWIKRVEESFATIHKLCNDITRIIVCALTDIKIDPDAPIIVGTRS